MWQVQTVNDGVVGEGKGRGGKYVSDWGRLCASLTASLYAHMYACTYMHLPAFEATKPLCIMTDNCARDHFLTQN